MTRRVRRAAPVLALIATAGAAVLGCATDERDPSAASSSSSTIAEVGGRWWVTSPDDGAVAVLDGSSLELERSVDVGGSPRQLAQVGDTVVVTNAAMSTVSLLRPDGDAGEAPVAVRVPCGGTEGAASLGGTGQLAVITCPNDARLVVVDTAAGAALGWVRLGGRPAGVAVGGARVTVAGGTDGRLWSVDAPTLRSASQAVQGDAAGGGAGQELAVEATPTEVWNRRGRSASMLQSVAADPGGSVAAYQTVDNNGPRPAGSDGSYGALTDGDPRIEPVVQAPCGGRFAHFDGSDRRLSGPVALAWDVQHRRLWVVGRFTNSVSVLDCANDAAPGETIDTLASFEVGEGARGIALAADGNSALVDGGFDHAVAELRLDPEAPQLGGAPERVVRRPVGEQHLSAAAQTGRRLFNDATDRHLTPSGVAACASCHLDGGDDGLTWRIATDDVPSKLRRTPALWGVEEGAKPLHWEGDFVDPGELTGDTTRNLLGGDGLLVDTSKVAAYLAELAPPPSAPPTAARGEASQAGRGGAVFDQRCAGCHAGPTGSDGRLHDLGRDPADPDAIDGGVVTPTLLGTRGRGPYLHDGSAGTLADAIDFHGGGLGSSLTDAQRDDLVRYLAGR